MMLIEHLFVVEKTTKLKSYIQQCIEQLEKQERFGHAETFTKLLDYLEKRYWKRINRNKIDILWELH